VHFEQIARFNHPSILLLNITVPPNAHAQNSHITS
jgi:hypothetical protein